MRALAAIAAPLPRNIGTPTACVVAGRTEGRRGHRSFADQNGQIFGISQIARIANRMFSGTPILTKSVNR